MHLYKPKPSLQAMDFWRATLSEILVDRLRPKFTWLGKMPLNDYSKCKSILISHLHTTVIYDSFNIHHTSQKNFDCDICITMYTLLIIKCYASLTSAPIKTHSLSLSLSLFLSLSLSISSF